MSDSGDPVSSSPAPPKKKRNLPGTPDPTAEVVALSPETLLATNRFVCEVCGKGFQRDQNLQLHRRGHNLPWRLRQRPPVGPDGAAPPPPRRRVYVCPEVGCVHHDPSRALGDLTGIKKHFCRKHGEKKWKCDRCGKKYAVAADLKAHAKTCGTKDYRCDCGARFTRRDSFMTHRAFCSALVEEGNKVELPAPAESSPAGEVSTIAEVNEVRSEEDCKTVDDVEEVAEYSQDQPPPREKEVVSVLPIMAEVETVASVEEELEKEDTVLENGNELLPCLPSSPITPVAINVIGANDSSIVVDTEGLGTGTTMDTNNGNSSCTTSLFAGLFTSVGTTSSTPQSGAAFPDLLGTTAARADRTLIVDPTFLCLAPGASASLFSQPNGNEGRGVTITSTPHMSATALLQKAAEVGPTTSRSSFLSEFVLSTSTSAAPAIHQHLGRFEDSGLQHWRGMNDERLDFEHQAMHSGGSIGFHKGGGMPVIPDMMGPTSLLRPPKPMFDFLSLGIGSMGGSALMTSISGGGLETGPTTMPPPWDVADPKRKPGTIL